MKRKKWSEAEEQTLLRRYADLLASGSLAKLRTREKKFKPIADHVNSVHHLHDPVSFPFKWSWRDVSIKVQNMRHQYLGVKQKIRVSGDRFNWDDGQNHWENFLMYKQVFGDVDIEPSSKGKRHRGREEVDGFDEDTDDGDDDVLGIGFGPGCEELEGDGGDGDDYDVSSADGSVGYVDFLRPKKSVKILLKNSGFQADKGERVFRAGVKVLELRDLMVRREERRREREWRREKCVLESEKDNQADAAGAAQREWIEGLERLELEFQQRQVMWARREFLRQARLEREFDMERRRRMQEVERREEEEMQWREKMVCLQIEHEKQMMQMHADACQNQMQILGVMAKLMCQFFGSASDGLGGGLEAPQILQHPAGLGEAEKPDTNSPPEFM